MKKQTRNLMNTARNFLVPALFVVLSITGLSYGKAYGQSYTSNSKPSIQYVGKVNDQLIFQVDYDNPTNEAVNVLIKDESGNVLYADRFKDKKLSKKFKVNTAEYGDARLTFVISTDKERTSQVFQVNTNTRVIDDVVVTNLK